METREIVADDILLRYYISAAPSGGALLFLHGWRNEGAVWFPIISRLQGRFLVVALDLPGFGGSQTPPESFDVGAYAHVVLGFIKKLGLKDVCVIGHSFGGRVAVKLAAGEDRLVTRIILVNSAGIPQSPRKNQAIRTLACVAKPFFHPAFMRPLRRKIYRLLGSEDYLETPHLRKVYQRVIGEDLSGSLPHILQPTLIFWGAKDEETPLSAAYFMERKIPHARLVVSQDAGHFSFLDDQEGFLRALEDFTGSSSRV